MSNEATLTMTITADADGDGGGAGIVLESHGFTEVQIVEALVRAAESILQRTMREHIDKEFFAGATVPQFNAVVSMQSRLSLMNLLTEMEFVDSIGIHMEL